MEEEEKRKGERKERGNKEKEKEKEREKKREKKRGRVRESERKKETVRGEKKKKKRERHFPSLSLANRLSKCVRVRDKVGPQVESYAWVPETVVFVALQEVGVFSYTGSSLFKSRK